MSLCINTNSFDNKNVSVGKTSDFKQFKLNKLYYKYDSHLSNELKLLTGFINIKNIKYSYKKIMFIVESPELKNILINIKKLIPIENNDDKDLIIDNQNNQENNNVQIYFKNEKSELKLNPTKKSNLDTYILTKNENYNQIQNYYPFMNKHNICGNFIVYLLVVNGKIKFYIESGELKHPNSFTKSDMTIKNVYDTKVVIDI